MYVPVAQCWSKLTQMALGKRCSLLWLLVIPFTVITWMFTYSAFNPSEPYIKRSHSPTTGKDSVVVVFTSGGAPADVGDGASNQYQPEKETPLAGERRLLLSFPNMIANRNKLRVDQMPFQVERHSAFEDGVEFSWSTDLDQPDMETSAPRIGESGNDQPEIPDNVLRIIFDNQENKNLSKQLLAKVSHLTGTNLPSWLRANVSRANPHPRPKLPRIEDPQSPDELSRWESPQIPKWILAGFWSVGNHDKAAGVSQNPSKPVDIGDKKGRKQAHAELPKTDVVEQTKPTVLVGEQQYSPLSVISKDSRGKADAKPLDPKRKSSIPLQLGKHDMPRPPLDMIDDIALLEEPPTSPKPDTSPKLHLNYVPANPSHRNDREQDNSFETYSEEDEGDYEEEDDYEQEEEDEEVEEEKNVALKTSNPQDHQMGTPDVLPPAKDSLANSSVEKGNSVLSSLNPLHLLKHNTPIGKILLRSYVADKNKAELEASKPSFVSSRQSKLVKNLLPQSDLAAASKKSDRDLQPPPPAGRSQHLGTTPKSSDDIRASKYDKAEDLSNEKDASSKSAYWQASNGGFSSEIKSMSDAAITDKKHSDLKLQSRQSKLNLTLWKGVQKERKKLLRAKCQEHSTKAEPSVTDTKSIVDKKKNFLYCPVEMTATSFFYRFMYSLKQSNRSKEITYPFHVPLQLAVNSEIDTIRGFHRKALDEFMESSVKFLVVREPFARLFSAYIDKLLVPNTFYWKKWGIPIVTKYRKYPSSKSATCGHDVTFPEFVSHVIDTLYTSDEIVKPVSVLCTPCELKFSLVGHLETLTSDIDYLASVLKISIANYSTETIMNDVVSDAVFESTYGAFEYYDDLQSCISKYEVGKRIWKKLQFRGIISDELRFYFAPKKVEKMTAADFVQAVNELRKTPMESEKLQEQKTRAIREAFLQVPAEDVMKLVKIYSLDFEFFGYDKHPTFLP